MGKIKITKTGDEWNITSEADTCFYTGFPTIDRLKERYLKSIEEKFDEEVNNIVMEAMYLRDKLSK